MAKKKILRKTVATRGTLDDFFAGKEFVLGGRLVAPIQRTSSNDAVKRLVTTYGGEVTADVSPATDYLIVPSLVAAKGKVGKATKLNAQGAHIQIIDFDRFRALASPTIEELLALILQQKKPVACRRYFHLVTWELDIPWPAFAREDLLKFHAPDDSGPPWSLAPLKLSNLDLHGWSPGRVELHQMQRVNLDGAALMGCEIQGDDCSFRKADLTSAMLAGFGNCDFTGATLAESSLQSDSFDQCDFTRADLRRVRWSRGKFEHCTFARANLEDADFGQAELTDCDFRGAKLCGAKLAGASLKKVDFTGAKLQRADLTGVDLTSVIVDKADFTGAIMLGVTLPVKIPKTAKGLTAARPLPSPGLALGVFEQATSQAFDYRSSTMVWTSPAESVELNITQDYRGQHLYLWRTKPGAPRKHESFAVPTLAAGMQLAAMRLGSGGTLDEATFKWSAFPKDRLSGREARKLALAAWREAFAIPEPTAAELARRAQQRADDQANWLTNFDLNRWHALTSAQRRQISLAGADLAGKDLRRADFQRADLSGANLARANLDDAFTNGGKLNNASLAGASLVRFSARHSTLASADLSHVRWQNGDAYGANFRGAKFLGATIADTDIGTSKLEGADFTGATFVNLEFYGCTYDEHTRFPAGFAAWKGMKWKGSGKKPVH